MTMKNWPEEELPERQKTPKSETYIKKVKRFSFLTPLNHLRVVIITVKC